MQRGGRGLKRKKSGGLVESKPPDYNSIVEEHRIADPVQERMYGRTFRFRHDGGDGRYTERSILDFQYGFHAGTLSSGCATERCSWNFFSDRGNP